MDTKTSIKYKELTSFIAAHDEIDIRPDKARIPSSIRRDFYKLFDELRLSFLINLLGNLLPEAQKQNDSYKGIEKEVMRMLGLDEVSMNPSLRRFIDDPCNELSRALFELTFDLLKNKITIDCFNGQASNIIRSVFTSLYISTYQKYLALSIVKLVNPNKLFTIELPEIEQYSIHKTGGREEPVLPPRETREIHFHYKNSAIFMVPDCIVRSQKLNKYVSICTFLQKPTVIATNPSEKRIWLDADFDQMQTYHQIIVYLGDTPEELSLVADKTRICQPDMIINSVPRSEWYDESNLLALNNNIIETFQPKLGILTILPEELANERANTLKGNGVNILKAGVNQDGLNLIFDILSKK